MFSGFHLPGRRLSYEHTVWYDFRVKGMRMVRSNVKTCRYKIGEVEKGRIKFKAIQSATASVNQGGNNFAINANELGNVRVRAGQQRG
jgi:hypothetical protein